MVTVVLDVSGGVVQAVYSDHSDVRVVKVDWDVGESPGDEVKAGDLIVDSIETMPEATRAVFATAQA